ncbi:MAG: hypothetical protein U0165_18100 [Polyangiaceae bacterium]
MTTSRFEHDAQAFFVKKNRQAFFAALRVSRGRKRSTVLTLLDAADTVASDAACVVADANDGPTGKLHMIQAIAALDHR